MSDGMGIFLGLCLLGAIAADVLLFDSGTIVFLGRKLIGLTEYIAFWR